MIIRNDQWNKKENEEVDAHICSALIFYKHKKAIQWKKIFQQMKQLNIPMQKIKNFLKKDPNLYLVSYAEISSEWIIDLNETSNAIKLPEKNIGENLGDFGIGKEFLTATLKALPVKELFYFLMVAVVTPVYVSVKTRRLAQFSVCKL